MGKFLQQQQRKSLSPSSYSHKPQRFSPALAQKSSSLATFSLSSPPVSKYSNHALSSNVEVTAQVQSAGREMHDVPLADTSVSATPLSPISTTFLQASTNAAAAAAAVSTTTTTGMTPSRSAHLAQTFLSVAVPVSSAAGVVLRSWVSAMKFGWAGAVKLRNEWKETMQAKRAVHELTRKYHVEKKAAKERERQAMHRLQELEAQLHTMQAQLEAVQNNPPALSLSFTDAAAPTEEKPQSAFVPAAPALAAHASFAPLSSSSAFSAASSLAQTPSPAAFVPQAPPLLGAVHIPCAPPMMSAHPASKVVPAAPASTLKIKVTAAGPANKPSSEALVAAAARLKSAAAVVAATKRDSMKLAKCVSSSGINLDMLRQVKLNHVAPPTTRSTHSNSFLLDALQAKFHRSHAAVAAAGAKSSSASAFPSFGGNAVQATPMQRPSHRDSSAFSPMTPLSEEQWTPAR